MSDRSKVVFLLVAHSEKQGGTSASTPEAELVAPADFIKGSALPSMSLWQTILGKDSPLAVYEDNEAAVAIVRTGEFKAMRHVLRHHGVRLGFLHDCWKDGQFDLRNGCRYIYQVVHQSGELGICNAFSWYS